MPVVFPDPPSAENFIFVKKPASQLSSNPAQPFNEFSISLWLYFMEKRYFVGTDDRYDIINLRLSRAISSNKRCQ